MRRRPAVSRDLALTVAAQLAFKLLGFLVLTLLARQLGPGEFGFLMFALATCELAALATEFGSSAHLTREVAVAPGRAPLLLGEVLGARLPLLALYLGLMAVVAAAAFPPRQAAAFLAIAAYAGLKDLSRAYSAMFFGSRRVVLGTVPFGSHLVALAAGVWLAAANGAGAVGVACAYLAAGVWLMAASWHLARRYGPVAPAPSAWRRVVGASLPLFGLGLLTMIQLRVDATLLGLLRSYADVATYEASARLFEASQAIVRPLTQVFLPIAAGLAAAGAYRDLRRSLVRLGTAALAAGVAAAAAVAAVAGPAISVVYGPAYAASAEVLRIHFAATPFVLVGAVALFHLTALRRERSALGCAAVGLALNVGLDLWLIPAAGARGAAWATLAAEGVTAAALLALAGRALAGSATPRLPLPRPRGPDRPGQAAVARAQATGR